MLDCTTARLSARLIETNTELAQITSTSVEAGAAAGAADSRTVMLKWMKRIGLFAACRENECASHELANMHSPGSGTKLMMFDAKVA